jgi:hypothetical protein
VGLAPLGVLPVIALAGAVTLAARAPGPGGDPAPAVAEWRVGGRPVALAATGPLLWVADRNSPRLRAFRGPDLRPAGRGRRVPVPPGAAPVGLSAHARVLWAAFVSDTDDAGWLARLDTARNRLTVRRLPHRPTGLAAVDGRRVVLTTAAGRVLRAGASGPVERVGGPGGVTAVARGGGRIWVLATDGAGTPAVRPLGAGRPPVRTGGGRVPLGVAAGPTAVWLTAACGRRAARLPHGGSRPACLDLRAERIWATPGGVWALEATGRLSRLDPRTGRAVERVTPPARPVDLLHTGAGGRGPVWAAAESGLVWRIAGDGRRATW